MKLSPHLCKRSHHSRALSLLTRAVIDTERESRAAVTDLDPAAPAAAAAALAAQRIPVFRPSLLDLRTPAELRLEINLFGVGVDTLITTPHMALADVQSIIRTFQFLYPTRGTNGPP